MFPTSEVSAPPEDCNVASVVITNRYFFIASAEVTKSSSPENNPLGIKLGDVVDLYSGDCEEGSLVTHPRHLEVVATYIAKIAPNARLIVVSAFGPFADQRCSAFSNLTRYPNWSKFNLREGFSQALDEHIPGAEIHLELDVKAASLGEHYWALQERHRVQGRKHWNSKLSKRRSAYIKASHGVNVGITSAGWISHDHHPQLSVIRPSRQIAHKRLDGVDFFDSFKGICEMHGDCVEGLISVDAMRARTKVNDFADIPEHHQAWTFAAYYIAELALLTTAIVSPARITLGGRLFRSPSTLRKCVPKDAFIKLVRDFFRRSLFQREDLSSPRYFELEDLETYLNYRSCTYPGIFGGFVISRDILFNTRPPGIPHAI